MKKTYCDYSTVERYCLTILRDISRDEWKPDYVVGITRGGLMPALLLSNWFDCPMHTLNVSLRDDNTESESNLWMAEDAFGYIPAEARSQSGTRWDPSLRKNILIVDDISETGATLDWIKSDWQSSCFPNETGWKSVWGITVRTAVLFNRVTRYNNESLRVNYAAQEISEDNDPGVIVFPWESWAGNRFDA